MVFKAYRYKLLQFGLDAVLRMTHHSADNLKYEGKSLNNRNFILKCMEKYAQ